MNRGVRHREADQEDGDRDNDDNVAKEVAGNQPVAEQHHQRKDNARYPVQRHARGQERDGAGKCQPCPRQVAEALLDDQQCNTAHEAGNHGKWHKSRQVAELEPADKVECDAGCHCREHHKCDDRRRELAGRQLPEQLRADDAEQEDRREVPGVGDVGNTVSEAGDKIGCNDGNHADRDPCQEVL